MLPSSEKIFFFAIGVFILLCASTESFAGTYHYSLSPVGDGGMVCTQCHTMHGSQARASMMYTTASLQPRLLRHTSIMNLCLYCHGRNGLTSAVDSLGRVPPRVEYNQSYTPSAGDFRSYDFVNDLNRHDIDDVSAWPAPPGNPGGAAWDRVTAKFGTAFCLYCHDQHGNENYRNLRYNPGDPNGDFATNTTRVVITFSADLSSPFADPGSTNYDVNYWGDIASAATNIRFARQNVRFYRGPVDNETDPVRGIAAFCGKCHVDFYGASGASNMGGIANAGAMGWGDDNSTTASPWVRHPVADISLGMGSTNRHADYSGGSAIGLTAVRVIEGTSAESVGADVTDQPFCLSCHYAHGGGNPNNATSPELDHTNLVMIDTAGVPNISTTGYNTATGMMRNTCNQCHNQ